MFYLSSVYFVSQRLHVSGHICSPSSGGILYIQLVKGKGKAVPLQAWIGPGGSRKLRFHGGKVVSLTHGLPLHPGNTPGTHFC